MNKKHLSKARLTKVALFSFFYRATSTTRFSRMMLTLISPGYLKSSLRYAQHAILLRMYTAIYKKVRSGYVAWVEEIPGVNTQVISKKEVRENLSDALSEFLFARRALTKRERSRGGSVVRERFALA